MISERQLVRQHPSFWRVAMPMSRSFTSFVAGRDLSYMAELQSDVLPDRRGLVNELAFGLFAEAVPGPVSGLRDDTIMAVVSSTEEYLRDLTPGGDWMASEGELEEATTLAERIAAFFELNHRKEKVEVFPEFCGCGLLDRCRGDVLVGRTLFEVKSGARRFQLDDLRQLVVYAALDYAAGRARFSNLGLLNPRMGLYARFTPEEVIERTAAKPPHELYSEVIEFVSSDRTSR